MAVCPACGKELPGEFPFCPFCGAPLSEVEPRRRGAEERKVVTALFCDLVGFTASSESADPEDVDRVLTAYSAMARAQIEGHGGVVEKFIGDAVVGVFGVPTAHEDDPERAVRAALRIVEAAEELVAVGGAPLRLRVAINTGEALVRSGSVAGSGERLVCRGRDQHRVAAAVGGARDGGRGRARHVRGDGGGVRLRGARAGDVEGQGRAGAGVSRQGSTGPASAPTSRELTTARSSGGRSTSRC